MLDADDFVKYQPNFNIIAFKNSLTREIYDVEYLDEGLTGLRRYQRPQIYSNRRIFLYRGVHHDFLDTVDRALSWGPGKVTIGRTRGFYVSSTRHGARGQDPDKHRKDAELIETALEAEKDKFLRSRYMFYLARTYQHAGDNQKALYYFLKRADLGFWHEEVFMSLYYAGYLQVTLGQPLDEVIATLLRACKVAPGRAEAFHEASRVCRENSRFAEGFEYARRGLAISMPTSGLFVVPWIYDYGLLDEFAVNAYWTERYQECLDACERLLRERKCPEAERPRIEQNAALAREKLN